MENLKNYEIKEITNLLKNDLYIKEIEIVENENFDLLKENEDLKETQKEQETENAEILENFKNNAVDIYELFDFLDNRNLLTEDLKKEIEYFQKFINVFDY